MFPPMLYPIFLAITALNAALVAKATYYGRIDTACGQVIIYIIVLLTLSTPRLR